MCRVSGTELTVDEIVPDRPCSVDAERTDWKCRRSQPMRQIIDLAVRRKSMYNATITCVCVLAFFCITPGNARRWDSHRLARRCTRPVVARVVEGRLPQATAYLIPSAGTLLSRASKRRARNMPYRPSPRISSSKLAIFSLDSGPATPSVAPKMPMPFKLRKPR